MKPLFNKITAVLVAFLLLLSTFSFTVAKHYCGDFLVAISFTGNADDCGMKMQKVTKKKNCCRDEVHQIEGQDELQQNSIDEFNFSKQQFLVSFYISYLLFSCFVILLSLSPLISFSFVSLNFLIFILCLIILYQILLIAISFTE